MLVGMGTVFAFLTILVFGMTTLSAVAMRFTPKAISDDVSDEEIAAITAAIASRMEPAAARVEPPMERHTGPRPLVLNTDNVTWQDRGT